ncbi:hypothetical protein D521_1880 [beta proteobacterium CB]|nr:hypothetical protein D521_1880 [beta proteobacterium CB]
MISQIVIVKKKLLQSNYVHLGPAYVCKLADSVIHLVKQLPLTGSVIQ